MTLKEKRSQEAEEYADTVAASGTGITYDDAYDHYMKKYFSQGFIPSGGFSFDNPAELNAAFEVRKFLRLQLQKAQVRHNNIKEVFFQDLVDNQDMVIRHLEKT